MVSVGLNEPTRAFALGLAAICLTACASVPATGLGGEGAPAAFEPEQARIAESGSRLQCVPYARRISGIEIYGDAVHWWRQAEGRYPRSNTPAPGSVLAIRGYNNPRRGHVAVVHDIVSERIIRVDHANWLNHGEISLAVPVLDVSEANDWSRIRVWHVPGRHWGGRVYTADGFIHPLTLRGLLS